MIISGRRFNTILLVAPALAAVLALLWGCQSSKPNPKKVFCTFRVHVEAGNETPEHNQQVQISRANPVSINVLKSPILTEASVKEAKVIEVVGGFALSVRFDTEGGWLLEQFSSANIGKHFAIFSQFPIPSKEKLTEGRWLAAPRIHKRISDGILIFTPDATREETDEIALGLNNLAKK
jgi:preprotein translocase subunit SecD